MYYYKENIPVAVIGAGMMGENHVRVYRQIRGVEQVYLYDVDFQKASLLAKKYGCIPIKTLEEIVKHVKAASIVTPTHFHAPVAKFLLEKKIHCLIEKPFADSLSACSELIEIADKNKCILMVGHIERFNPAIKALQQVLTEEKFKILAMHSQRMSYESARVRDINVVMDLMVHDVDIICSVIEDKIQVEHVSGITPAAHEQNDHVSAFLRSDSGIPILLTVSRITANKIRKLEIICENALLTVDYMQQELKIFRSNYNGDNNQRKFGQETIKLDVRIEKVLVRNQEPLMGELNNFISSVTNGEAVVIDGKASLRVMKLIFNIQERLVGDVRHS